MRLNEARNILLDWKCGEFFRKNNRFPNPEEEEVLEMEITEDELRDVAESIMEYEQN
jgi:hypothetical protein